MTETKLAVKFTGAGNANIPGLMLLLIETAREKDLKDTLADKLIGAARVMDIPDEKILDTLAYMDNKDMSLRPRPGETATDVFERVTKAAGKRFYADIYDADGRRYVFDEKSGGAEVEGPFDTPDEADAAAARLNQEEE